MKSGSAEQKLTHRRLRAYARIEISGEVLIHNEEQLYIAPLSNLSAGGCFVSELNSIPEGSEVKIVVRSKRLKLPIQAKGVVVRVERTKRIGLAIEFTSIPEEARESIQTLVYEHKVQNALRIM